MITQWKESFDPGEMAWMLLATVSAFLLLWPGLTIFYCGILGKRELPEIARRWLVLIATLTVAWGVWNYSFAFGPSWGTVPTVGPDDVAPMFTDLQELMAFEEAKENISDTQGRGGVIGGLEYSVLQGLTPVAGHRGPAFPSRRRSGHMPHLLFMAFQMMIFLAVPVPLLLVLYGRIPWSAVLAFAILWGTVVYAPLVHWIWGDGWLAELGALDSAGGLLHLGVGFSALACALLLPRGGGMISDREAPAAADDRSQPALVYAGAVLFWAATLVLHAALVMKPDGRAATALLNSHLAAAGGLLGWAGTAHFARGRSNVIAPAAGAVAGLAAVSAGSGLIVPQSSLVVGFAGGAAGCVVFELARRSLRESETMAPFALQGITGSLGILAAGIFVTSSAGGLHPEAQMVEGLAAGNSSQLGIQGLAAAAAAAWAFLGTALILLLARLIAMLGRAREATK